MKNRPLLSIFLIIVADIFSFTIMIPLLPFYAEMLGGGPLVVGLLMATYGFCQFFSGPVLGHVSDSIGRKPLLLLSQAGTLIGFIIMFTAHSLGVLFLARVIDGITAGNLSLAQAYIADVTEPKDRAKSFGLVGIAFGLGFLFGPGISGLLSHFGYRYPILAAAALSAASIAGTYFLLPGGRADRAQGGPAPKANQLSFRFFLDAFKDRALSPLLWQFLAFIFSFSVFVSGFALFCERRFTHHGVPFGPREVGYVFAYVGLIGVIIQARMIGHLVRAFGESRLVQSGFIFMVLGFLLLGVAGTVPLLLAAVSLAFIGSSVLRPSLTSLITQKTGKERQGMALGLTQSLMSVSQITAPLVSGFLIQHRHLGPWAWVGAVTSSAGLVLVHKNASREKRA